MGTPAFACPILDALLGRPDPIVGVVTQPDRPRGRGLSVTPPEVKVLAQKHGLPVLQPDKVKDPAFEQALRALRPELIVVAAYGRILPRAILELPPHGCINVHASLLPRHRGAAPIAWAILAGDHTTGVTTMNMAEEMDAGDMLLQRATPIGPEETGGELTVRLAALGADLLVETLDALRAGTLRPRAQADADVTYAPRIDQQQRRIDWKRPAEELARLVRALSPAPAAFTTLGPRRLKVFRARPDGAPTTNAAPGTALAAGGGKLVVATGRGALELLEVQLEGRRRLAAAEFLVGHPLAAGTCLGSA
jgi:methionyl-tRNA formyltransferase